MAFTRKLSPTERFYISCDDHTGTAPARSVANQMVLEGTGDVDVAAWERAVKEASMALQGTRLKLSRKLGFSRWVDAGKTTPFVLIEGHDWDGLSSDNSPFLDRPLSVREGTGCEVLLVRGSHKHHIIFRTHHAVMDGRGTKTFADEVLRALNGEPLKGDNHFVRDLDMAKKITKVPGKQIHDTVTAPTGLPQGDDFGSSWQRRTLPGSYKKVLANAGISIAKVTKKYSDSAVRIQLPVDLRMHDINILSTGNLTGGLLMHVTDETTPESWAEDIKSQLAQNQHARIPRFAHIPVLGILNWVPLSQLKRYNNKLAARRNLSGQYRTSGIISNLGFLPVEDFSAAGFRCSSVFFIPPYFNTTALFLVLAGNKDAVEVILRIPKQLARDGRFEQVLDSICDGITHGHHIS